MRSFFVVGESDKYEMEIYFSVNVADGKSVLKAISKYVADQKKKKEIPKDFNLLSVEQEEI